MSSVLKIITCGRGLPIRCNDEDIAVDSQVFAITTAGINAYGAGWPLMEEPLYYRPWLFNSQYTCGNLDLLCLTHTLYRVEEKCDAI